PHTRFSRPNTLAWARPAPSAPSAQSGNPTAYWPLIGSVAATNSTARTSADGAAARPATTAAMPTIETTATSSITESAATIVRLPPTDRTSSPTPTGAGAGGPAGARATTTVSTTMTRPSRMNGARRP